MGNLLLALPFFMRQAETLTQIAAFAIQTAVVFGNASFRGFVNARNEGSTTGSPSYTTIGGATVAVNGLFSFGDNACRISVTSGTAVGDMPSRIMSRGVIGGQTRVAVLERVDNTWAARGLGSQCDYSRIVAESTHTATQTFAATTVNVTLYR